MIPIRSFHTICQQLVADIAGLDHFHLVAEDNQAVKKLKDDDGIILVAVIPSADGTGTSTANIENHTTFLFVVSKPGNDDTPDEELDLYEKTQQITEQVKKKIIAMQEDGCTDFFRLEPSSITIDPEFNIFGGFLGWSLSLVF